ncbi:hypothetical protein HUT18_18345 [Streptomyces sp. NA04227]|uniref:hypothetical protein n=1 Tax=Streptomyces sp. NA04227 TaxID=2742136 RepID=UPI00158FD8D8|nr:hypothetical protein [Streptomyces sp. NA04227]QKW08048.1 hypothetical protein HUT18_18345 [Streptomyces sp. NA04227]
MHPNTGLRAVGRRRDGRPIWPILGGSGEDDPASALGPEAQPASADTVPNAENPAAPAPTTPEADAQQLAAAEQRAREQAERAEQLQTALDAVQRALNPDDQDGGADPAALAAQVAERDSQLASLTGELRTARVELAAYRAAGEHEARADRLLNSRSFLDQVAALDPDDAKFGERLAAAITSAVEADPELYRATTAPPRGGAEINGAPAGERRPVTLHDAVAARLGG